MKKLVASIIFSLISFCFLAQNYKLLPDSCTYCFYTVSSSFSGDESKYYSIEKATFSAPSSNTYSHYINDQSGFQTNDTLVYFRQVGNKVFGLPKDSVDEYLVMDFDVNIGDTISDLMSVEGIVGPWYYRAIVQDKDSLQMSDGSYHNFIQIIADSIYSSEGFQGSWGDIVWQEKGLCYANNLPNVYANGGGLIYNFGPHVQPDLGIYLNPTNCSTDTIIPSNFYNYGHSCDLCNPIANGIIERNPSLFTVYPNPTTETVNITFTNSSYQIGNLQYIITDLQGRVVLQESNFSMYSSIDLSLLNPGIYLFTLYSGLDLLGTERVVLER